MTSRDVEIVRILRSRADVDFTLSDQDGHIIASYFSEEKSKIPGSRDCNHVIMVCV